MSAGTWRPVMYVPLSHHYMQPAIDPEAEWPGFYERLRQHAERADMQKRLCKAVYQGDEDEVIRMLKEGFDPNSSYSAPLLRDTRMSALELAVLTQQSLIVNLLLFSRADPMHNKYDGSPLPSFVPNNPSITIVGTAQPQPGFNGLLNLLELTHPADSPSHEMTRLWLEVARSKHNWRRCRRGYKIRCIVMYWIGITAEATCAEGGAGRARDQEAFVEEFEGLGLS